MARTNAKNATAKINAKTRSVKTVASKRIGGAVKAKTTRAKTTRAKAAGARRGGRTTAVKARPAPARNPLLAPWTTPFEMPPFDLIAPEHFLPAFNRAFAAHIREIEAIAGDRARPTFENTVEALERSGRQLERVACVFHNLAATDTNDAIQAIERRIAPRFARHSSRIYQDTRLFRRIDTVMKARDRLGLGEEQGRVLE